MDQSARLAGCPAIAEGTAEETNSRALDSAPLRLLLIEDDPADALLVVRELRRSGYRVTWERVQTAPALEEALQQAWDVITCDWVMPSFSAEAALKILGTHGIEPPIIIESAAERGATIYSTSM